MRPLMFRFLGFSLVLLAVGACGTLPDLENFRQVSVVEKTFAHNPYFLETHKAHIYEAEISIYGNELSGTFVLRKMNDTLHRAAFLSGFGNTLLDISFGENYSKLNYSIKKLDKKYIIAILVEDFRLLTVPKRKVVESYENPNTKLLKTLVDDGFVYCYFDKNTQQLQKLTKTTGRKKKVDVYFSDFKKQIPQTIKIAHYGLKLTIVLNAIPQTYAD